MPSIGVVISAWNEEAKIEKCLESVHFADEIIFVDNTSTDRTVSLVKKYKVKLYIRENNPMLNLNKNFGFSQATSNWILSLDADEEIPAKLGQEIRSAIDDAGEINGFWITRKNIIFGKWIRHGLWWPDKQLRLFRKNMGKFPCKHVHEYLELEGKTTDLETPYIHYNYDTISQFIRKMDFLYTESEVAKLSESKYQFTWHDAIKFPASDFVKIYIAQEGYKDGLHGLVLAGLQAFYAFIVFAKLWERSHFTDVEVSISSVEKELSRSAKEMKYWTYTKKLKQTESTIAKIWLKILRRINAST